MLPRPSPFIIVGAFHSRSSVAPVGHELDECCQYFWDRP